MTHFHVTSFFNLNFVRVWQVEVSRARDYADLSLSQFQSPQLAREVDLMHAAACEACSPVICIAAQEVTQECIGHHKTGKVHS